MPSLGDMLFALAQWLRSTQLAEFSLWISHTPLSMLIDQNFWAIPVIQTIHILAIATTFGAVLMVNLRLFEAAGMPRTMPQTASRFVPWIWWGLLILLVTGVMMVIGEPVRELINPCFWIKMVLVAFAALVGLWFQSSVRRNAAWLELTPERRVVVRVGSVAVVALWLVIMVLGRWIAYAPV